MSLSDWSEGLGCSRIDIPLHLGPMRWMTLCIAVPAMIRIDEWALVHLLSNVCVLTKYSQAIEIENFAVPVLMVADLRVGLLGGPTNYIMTFLRAHYDCNAWNLLAWWWDNESWNCSSYCTHLMRCDITTRVHKNVKTLLVKSKQSDNRRTQFFTHVARGSDSY